MKSLLIFLVIVLNSSNTRGSTLESCPKVNFIKTFHVAKFLGLWHQFAISGDLFRSRCEKRVTQDWTLTEEGRNITITMSRICSKGMICRQKQTIWRAELRDPDTKTGKFTGKLNLTVRNPDFGTSSLDLLVVSTDYTQSAILYTCSHVGNRTMAIWILTRKQKPTEMEMADILTAVDATLESNRLDHYEFRITNQQCEDVINEHSKAKKQDDKERQQNFTSLQKNSTTHENNSIHTLEKQSKIIASNTTSRKNETGEISKQLVSSNIINNTTKPIVPKQNISETLVKTPDGENLNDNRFNVEHSNSSQFLRHNDQDKTVNKTVGSLVLDSTKNKPTNSSNSFLLINVDRKPNGSKQFTRNNGKIKEQAQTLLDEKQNSKLVQEISLQQKFTNSSRLNHKGLNKTSNNGDESHKENQNVTEKLQNINPFVEKYVADSLKKNLHKAKQENGTFSASKFDKIYNEPYTLINKEKGKAKQHFPMPKIHNPHSSIKYLLLPKSKNDTFNLNENGTFNASRFNKTYNEAYTLRNKEKGKAKQHFPIPKIHNPHSSIKYLLLPKSKNNTFNLNEFNRTSHSNTMLQRNDGKTIKGEQHLKNSLEDKKVHIPFEDNISSPISAKDSVMHRVSKLSEINILRNKGKTERHSLGSLQNKYVPAAEILPFEKTTRDNQLIFENNKTGKNKLQVVLDNLNKRKNTNLTLSENNTYKPFKRFSESIHPDPHESDAIDEKAVSDTFSNNGLNPELDNDVKPSETREDKFAARQGLGSLVLGENSLPSLAQKALYAFLPKGFNVGFLRF